MTLLDRNHQQAHRRRELESKRSSWWGALPFVMSCSSSSHQNPAIVVSPASLLDLVRHSSPGCISAVGFPAAVHGTQPPWRAAFSAVIAISIESPSLA